MKEIPIVRDGTQAGLLVIQDAGDFAAWEGIFELCHKAAAAVGEEVDFYAAGDVPWTVTVRLGGEEEARVMNREFRHKDYATNVLSFPAEADEGEGETERFAGDVFICVPVVRAEAREQGKQENHHLMHMVVHGMMHLAGYDHDNEGMAKAMEDLESAILADIGVPDPYEVRA